MAPYMEFRPPEKDWKLFRVKSTEWQERYMEKLVREYSEIINGEGLASHKFWALEKRLKRDKHSPGVLLDMRRSMMMLNLVNLLNDGVISSEDLEGFSDEITDRLKFVLGSD